MAGETGYDVVLLPTYAQAGDWRRIHAGAGGGLFGQTVATFDAWVADLWELHGDGRMPVDARAREAAMRAAFVQCGDCAPASSGTVSMAARCEQLAAGLGEFDQAVSLAREGRVAGLSPGEHALLSGVAAYRELIARMGWVEPGEACALLARKAHAVFPRGVRVLVAQAEPPGWRMRRFLEGCPQLEVTVSLAPGAGGVERAPGGTEVRVAYPAGRYATAGLVADIVREGDAGGRTVVAASDPVRLFSELEPQLARMGVPAGVQASLRFGDVDFGRMFLLLHGVTSKESPWDADQLADVLLSPLSGISPGEARAVDARLRADRLAGRAASLEAVGGAHPEFSELREICSLRAWPQALDRVEDRIRDAAGKPPAWRATQLSAVDAARGVLELAGRLDLGAEDAAEVLRDVSLPVSWMASDGAPGEPRVLVTDRKTASRMVAGSCERLVVADLTAADCPLADDDDAATTLFGKLGLQPVDDALSRERRAFHALVRVPARQLVLMRPLNDAEGNPAYPSAMLEEFIDAYEEPATPEGAGAGKGLPSALAAGVLQRGEELLYANARAADPSARQAMRPPISLAEPGDLAQAGGTALLLPRGVRDGGVLLRSPSPSQVELYLECPYKWFVMRRLKAERLEEGFGALERGTFAHAVLERFYRGFADEGFGKVDADNLLRARARMREAADEVERDMRRAEPGSGRLVAANRLEEYAIAQLKAQLEEYLDYEAQLLPTFRPAYLEYAFDGAHAADYAGCRLVGTVDRIDVDDKGRAVIIDYKGSVNAGHDIADKDAAHPGKVQARMYAQVVKRELGLDVVGALYVGYGRRHAVAGAVDGRAIEASHLPGMRADAVWCASDASAQAAPAEGGPAARGFAEMPFAEMLDATESLVARAVERMERGDAAPAPSSPDACAYCPVAACPKRGA